VVIVGAGIVGLVLALALHQQLGITPVVYEKGSQFQPIGAGMSVYPNGLRVLRDIGLLKTVQNAGFLYTTRQWERHDGSVIMTAQEEVLGRNENDTTQLRTVGIKRWKLQIILLSAVQSKGIPIYFGKAIQEVRENNSRNGTVDVQLSDGTHRTASLVLAADGTKSVVRKYVTETEMQNNPLKHAGTTTLMGLASIPRNDRISVVTSLTSQCHAVFFPVSSTEQCFQFHFPMKETGNYDESWATMTTAVEQEQCQELAQRLTQDGWDEQYIRPLRSVSQAIQITSCLLDQKLETWVRGNVVLLGDAAHPPVPFIGQGAQQGLEDAGTLALLLRALSCSTRGKLDVQNVSRALRLYEQIRIPRANELLDLSQLTGDQRRKRSQCARYAEVREEIIQRQVFFHETNPNMLPGATHDYKKAVEKALKALPERRMPILIEDDEDEEDSVSKNRNCTC
jgi:salicylate hydroxylase